MELHHISQEVNMEAKILVIEDDPEIVTSISLALQIYWPKSQVISSNLGEQGVEMVKAEEPDIVVLDLGLPDISGYEVLKRIRMFSALPVIILTVRSQEEDVVRALEGDASDYIIKPFRQKELLARLQAQLNLWMTRRIRDSMI